MVLDLILLRVAPVRGLALVLARCTAADDGRFHSAPPDYRLGAVEPRVRSGGVKKGEKISMYVDRLTGMSVDRSAGHIMIEAG